MKQIPAGTGEASASGYYLAGLKAGTYVNYSVYEPKEGDYTVNTRVSAANAGGTFHLNIDQKPLSKPLSNCSEAGHLDRGEKPWLSSRRRSPHPCPRYRLRSGSGFRFLLCAGTLSRAAHQYVILQYLWRH